MSEGVNKKTGEIVPLSADMPMARAPQVVLLEAQKAAQALQDVIKKQANAVVFNGKHYIAFESWQVLGQFYGFNVQTGEAQPIEIHGVQGAKAKATLLNREGVAVGGAEAYCLRDEPNWGKKPWAQLASMAQTRAGAKALRNRLAWVAVLAGYEPTPAEEYAHAEAKPPVRMPAPKPVATEPDGGSYAEIIEATGRVLETDLVGENVFVGRISGVQTDPRQGKNGTFNTYRIVTQGGGFFGTLDEAIANQAKAIEQNSQEARIEWEPDKKTGKFKNVKSISVVAEN